MSKRYNRICAVDAQGRSAYVKSMSEARQTITFTRNKTEARHFPYNFDKACGYIDDLTIYPIALERGMSFYLDTVD